MRVSTGVSLLAVGLVIASSPGGAATKCEDRTPAGARLRLAPPGEPGERLVLVGRVVGVDGDAVPGATVYLYHAGTDGEYAPLGTSEPRLCGVLRTDARGAFRVETVLPSRRRNLEGGPPHIHGWAAAAGGPRTGFVVNLEPRERRFADAARRASVGNRRSTTRTVYRDPAGTWWLMFDPVAG